MHLEPLQIADRAQIATRVTHRPTPRGFHCLSVYDDGEKLAARGMKQPSRNVRFVSEPYRGCQKQRRVTKAMASEPHSARGYRDRLTTATIVTSGAWLGNDAPPYEIKLHHSETSSPAGPVVSLIRLPLSGSHPGRDDDHPPSRQPQRQCTLQPEALVLSHDDRRVDPSAGARAGSAEAGTVTTGQSPAGRRRRRESLSRSGGGIRVSAAAIMTR
eukprot:g12140.t1